MHLIALLLALCISSAAIRVPVYLRKIGSKVDIDLVHGELWLVRDGDEFIVGRPAGRPFPFYYGTKPKLIDSSKASLSMSPPFGECMGNDDILQDNFLNISLALYEVLLDPSIDLPSSSEKPILRLEYDMQTKTTVVPDDILFMASMLALNQRQENWSRRSISMTRGIKIQTTLRIEIAPDSAFCI